MGGGSYIDFLLLVQIQEIVGGSKLLELADLSQWDLNHKLSFCDSYITPSSSGASHSKILLSRQYYDIYPREALMQYDDCVQESYSECSSCNRSM